MSEPRATLIKPSTIHFERLLPGPIERVWAYLTDSKKRATWLAAGEWELRLGGRIEMHVDNARLTDDPPPPSPGKKTVEGRITRFERLRALGHTWNWDGGQTEVLYELTPKGKDVLLTIHHKLPDDRGLKIGISSGWVLHTGILLDLLNGVKPRPFHKTHEQLKKEYEAAI